MTNEPGQPTEKMHCFGPGYLGHVIKIEAEKKCLDPFSTPFKPADLGINANRYGSFSDWCANGQTKSSKYNKSVCLTVAKFNKSGQPHLYLLLPENDWK
jgi:hypothetical protein